MEICLEGGWSSDRRMAKEAGTKRFRLKYDIIAHHFRDTFHPVNYYC